MGDSAGHLSALALDLYRACRELPVDRYQRWALERLQSVLPFDAALWATFHLDAGLIVVHNVVLLNRPGELMRDYERVKHQDELAYRNFASPGLACISNDVADRAGTAAQIAAYVRKWRITHAMSVQMVDPMTDLANAIALWREKRDAPFDEESRRLFEHAAAHLIETYGMNRIAHMVRATKPKNASLYVSAIADGQGRLQVAPQAFIAMLRREWPDWRGHELPEDLACAFRGVRAPRFVGREVFFRGIRFKKLVLVQAREKQPADELTPRELQVARLAAGGLSYGEVARHLTISLATVRSHLSSVYGKLKARKQAEMVSRLAQAE